MNKRAFVTTVALVAVAGAIWYLMARNASPTANLDAFAQCLAAKNITMYGAAWCPHCQNEKKAFGSSFKLVPYVECPDDPQKCIDAGIAGYPTWIFPGGKKLEGEQGLERLSEESGCALPAK